QMEALNKRLRSSSLEEASGREG
ncbi:hypothetical protein TrRE_jg3224, partial [Triparma retinervis]